MVRPSESVTVRESSSTATWVARASVLTLAVTSDVLIPSGSDEVFVLFNQLPDVLQLAAEVSVRFSK